MGIWDSDPEWFDTWIEQRALGGQFGEVIRAKVEDGELLGYELWAMRELDPHGNLGSEAYTAYCERLIP